MDRPADHSRRTFQLLERRRYDLAEAEARAWVAAAPGDSTPHALLALCLTERGRPADGAAEAEEAVRLAPDHALGHYALAFALERLGRHAPAARSAEEAIRLNPDEPGFHSLLGWIRIGQGRWEEALDAIDRALALDPEHAAALSARALALQQLGRPYRAWEAIHSAFEKSPEDDLLHATAGWARLTGGDPEGALHDFREALRLNPENHSATRGFVLAAHEHRWLVTIVLLVSLRARALTARQRRGLLAGAGLVGVAGCAAVAWRPSLLPAVAPAVLLLVGGAVLVSVAERLFEAISEAVIRRSAADRPGAAQGHPDASTWLNVCLFAAAALGFPGLVKSQPIGIAGGVAALALFLPLRAALRSTDAGVRRLMGVYAGVTALPSCLLVLLAGTRWLPGTAMPVEAVWLWGLLALLAALAMPIARRLEAARRRLR